MDGNYIITANGSFANEADLYHWGIKGMRWGVRRYQNADGSLTAAGRRRYTNSDGSLNEKGKKYYAKERARLIAERKVIMNTQKTNDQLSRLEAQRRNNEALKKANAPKKEETSKPKTAKEMTDDELDKAIARAKKEDEYNRLRPAPVKKPGFMDDLISNVVKPAVMQSGKNMLASVMDKAVKDLMKDKIDPNSYEALKKTYDKLKLKRDIEALKNGNDILPPVNTWDDLSKKLKYEKGLLGDDSSDKAPTKNENNDSKKQKTAETKTSDESSKGNGKSESKKVENTSQPVKDTVSKGKKAVEKQSYGSGKQSGKQETNGDNRRDIAYGTKAYKKAVDKMLAEIDAKGWDRYYRERGDD